MRKTSNEVLNKLRELRDKGYTQKAAAALLNRNAHAIAQLCLTYKISGWPRGAAARDQTGIHNSQYINGLSKASVNRLSKQVLLNRHHIDKNRADNSNNNLQVLCVSCHTKWHALERREIKAIRASV